MALLNGSHPQRLHHLGLVVPSLVSFLFLCICLYPKGLVPQATLYKQPCQLLSSCTGLWKGTGCEVEVGWGHGQDWEKKEGEARQTFSASFLS